MLSMGTRRLCFLVIEYGVCNVRKEGRPPVNDDQESITLKTQQEWLQELRKIKCKNTNAERDLFSSSLFCMDCNGFYLFVLGVFYLFHAFCNVYFTWFQELYRAGIILLCLYTERRCSQQTASFCFIILFLFLFVLISTI